MPTIFRWIGVNNGPGSNPGPISGTAHPPVQPSLESVAFSSPDAKQFGMENFGGHTCYANSVLQALYFCQPFRDLVCMAPDRFQSEAQSHSVSPAPRLSAPDSAPEPSPPIPSAPPTLFSALRALYIHISTHPATKGTISPTSFINKLKKENEIFRSSMHQDAHEFLNYLLNKIVEDLEADLKDAKERAQQDDLSKSISSLAPSTDASRTDSSPSQPTYSGFSAHPTLVQTLFEGVLTNETRCLTCETVSSRDESFLDLSIDIEQNSSVTACLRQFSASEMLCQKNKFFCDSCCGLQEAEKRMKIKTLPNVLALHLKRFKLLPDEDKYVKLAYRVAFPLELRLFNTVDDAEDPDRLYRLFSIVVHIGGGPHHGHYVTIVKAYGEVWRVFDDDTVYPIPESDIPRYFGDAPAGAGYVLFYQAADLNPEALGLSPKAAPTPGHMETATSPNTTIAESPLSVSSSSESSASLTRVPDPAPVGTPDPSLLPPSAVPSSAPPRLTAPPSAPLRHLLTHLLCLPDGHRRWPQRIPTEVHPSFGRSEQHPDDLNLVTEHLTMDLLLVLRSPFRCPNRRRIKNEKGKKRKIRHPLTAAAGFPV
ncbi:hypothetical protein BS47DRAFT_651701 [Hydnum rufescens UP504]|uniref:ubiquitinyl hydrolase 1 n=1 Tax=Hydnum rufescens UP504 TaxID=1448309 RepID=A0A9P6B361_9AGAM|nr:hypothetical protein BS47DRAFT_651701 [Hydnum rufescens UP504]